MNRKNKLSHGKWFVRVAAPAVAAALVIAAGIVWAADVNIDLFTNGAYNLSRDTVGTSTYLATASSALDGYRFMILEVTQAASGQVSQWGVNASSGFISLAIPPGDQGRAKLQWDGNDNSTTLDCTTGLNGENVSDSGNNTAIVVRIISSDSVAKNLTLRVYTNCSNWRTLTKSLPMVADNNLIDIPFLFTDFGGGAGTINWTSVNAIELEIDGTLASGPDAIAQFVKATGEVYEYGDLPVPGTPSLPVGQTGFSSSTILAVRHLPTNSGKRLGAQLDTEANYQSSALANGDNNASANDEDGVVKVLLSGGGDWAPGAASSTTGGRVNITRNGCDQDNLCYVSGWIDWNRDGDFGDTNEQIANDLSYDSNGSSYRTFAIPSGTSFTNVRYYARYRICAAEDTCDTPDTTQTNVSEGEIEDHYYQWGNPPTAVDLVSFIAAPAGGGVRLEWETASELENVGFNLYRAASLGGPRLQLNSALIPGQASGTPLGATYEFVDAPLGGGAYYYWLGAVGLAGEQVYEPIFVALPYRVLLPVVIHTRH